MVCAASQIFVGPGYEEGARGPRCYTRVTKLAAEGTGKIPGDLWHNYGPKPFVSSQAFFMGWLTREGQIKK